jgi:adiponectin receptor
MSFYRWFYIGTNWTCCLFAALIVVFYSKQGGWLNALAFGSAIVSALPGCIHLAFLADNKFIPHWQGMPWLMGVILYFVGGFIYATKIPEAYFKKTFDLVGSSHQIFHLFVLAASLLHFWASIKGFHERQLF